MKKQTQSPDRQAFLDKIAAVRAQARDLGETDEKIHDILTEEKLRLFEELKRSLPMDTIYHLFALYRRLPVGGFSWQYFLGDVGLIEPLGNDINLFDAEWCDYFNLEGI